jgi:hypothetical protein
MQRNKYILRREYYKNRIIFSEGIWIREKENRIDGPWGNYEELDGKSFLSYLAEIAVRGYNEVFSDFYTSGVARRIDSRKNKGEYILHNLNEFNTDGTVIYTKLERIYKGEA